MAVTTIPTAPNPFANRGTYDSRTGVYTDPSGQKYSRAAAPEGSTLVGGGKTTYEGKVSYGGGGGGTTTTTPSTSNVTTTTTTRIPGYDEAKAAREEETRLRLERVQRMRLGEQRYNLFISKLQANAEKDVKRRITTVESGQATSSKSPYISERITPENVAFIKEKYGFGGAYQTSQVQPSPIESARAGFLETANVKAAELRTTPLGVVNIKTGLYESSPYPKMQELIKIQKQEVKAGVYGGASSAEDVVFDITAAALTAGGALVTRKGLTIAARRAAPILFAKPIASTASTLTYAGVESLRADLEKRGVSYSDTEVPAQVLRGLTTLGLIYASKGVVGKAYGYSIGKDILTQPAETRAGFGEFVTKYPAEFVTLTAGGLVEPGFKTRAPKQTIRGYTEEYGLLGYDPNARFMPDLFKFEVGYKTKLLAQQIGLPLTVPKTQPLTLADFVGSKFLKRIQDYKILRSLKEAAERERLKKASFKMTARELRDYGLLGRDFTKAKPIPFPDLSKLFEIPKTRLRLETYLGSRGARYVRGYGARINFEAVAKELAYQSLAEKNLGYLKEGARIAKLKETVSYYKSIYFPYSKSIYFPYLKVKNVAKTLAQQIKARKSEARYIEQVNQKLVGFDYTKDFGLIGRKPIFPKTRMFYYETKGKAIKYIKDVNLKYSLLEYKKGRPMLPIELDLKAAQETLIRRELESYRGYKYIPKSDIRYLLGQAGVKVRIRPEELIPEIRKLAIERIKVKEAKGKPSFTFEIDTSYPKVTITKIEETKLPTIDTRTQKLILEKPQVKVEQEKLTQEPIIERPTISKYQGSIYGLVTSVKDLAMEIPKRIKPTPKFLVSELPEAPVTLAPKSEYQLTQAEEEIISGRQREIDITKQIQSSDYKLLFLTRQAQKQKSIVAQRQRIQSQASFERSIQKQISKQTQRQFERQAQEQRQRYRQRMPFKYEYKFKERSRLFPKEYKPEKGKKKKIYVSSFDILEITKGKPFVRARGLPRETALDIGTRDILRGLKATFILRKSDLPARSMETGREFARYKGLFRAPARTSRYKRLGEAFIQKQSRTNIYGGRLAFLGERREIRQAKINKIMNSIR